MWPVKDPTLLHIRHALKSLDSKVDALGAIIEKHEGHFPDHPVHRAADPGTPSLVYYPPVRPDVGNPGTPGEQTFTLPTTPQHHSTAPQNILLWPCLQASLPYLDNMYALRGEIAEHNKRNTRNLQILPDDYLTAQENILSSLTLAQIKCLITAFFDDVPVYSSVMVESEFADQILGPVLTGSNSSGSDVCIVLLVLFLGAKALRDQADPAIPEQINNTLGVFLDPDESEALLVQLCLRVRYSAEISWRSAQALLLTGNPQPQPHEFQIFWMAYLHECQILAEFELPASGIGRYEDIIPFPFSGRRNASEPGGLLRVSFLAHLALRKLLNRIHSTIYYHETPSSNLTASSSLSTGFSTTMSVIKELDHQLELWRQHLPAELAFPTLDQMTPWQGENYGSITTSPYDRALGTLKTRYCAAKSIILRPFLYKALHPSPHESVSPSELEYSRLCLLAVLQAPLHQGILTNILRASQTPMNIFRHFFAAAILLRLVDRRHDLRHLLPSNWEIIYDIQRRVELEVSHLSPTIAEDMRILRRLDETGAV
ncbi:fungal specific transcription factor domain-containing protein [Aspergillus stella-maris]|uniref:fungal specific transcription factor domain-containing protein n=1 Tax=Aspergillus stella-maris TaxID=1810926 RepID=UPI003CCD74D7